MAFNNKLKQDNYYDNYIYKKAKVKQMPEFDGYNIMVRLDMIYKYIIKYLNFLFSSKPNRLLITSLTKNPKITIEQKFLSKTVLPILHIEFN